MKIECRRRKAYVVGVHGTRVWKVTKTWCTSAAGGIAKDGVGNAGFPYEPLCTVLLE